MSIVYSLSGPLAQFGRPGLVKTLAHSLADKFAGNLATRLSGTALPSASRAELNGAALLFDLVRSRIHEWFRRATIWRRHQ